MTKNVLLIKKSGNTPQVNDLDNWVLSRRPTISWVGNGESLTMRREWVYSARRQAKTQRNQWRFKHDFNEIRWQVINTQLTFK